MVATRSGVRAFSPNGGETQECSADMEATPTARRTRRSTVQGGAQLHSDATNEHQHDEGGSSTLMEARSSTVKRKTRSSTRQEENAAQPDSTHEADVSESESCCSAASESRSRPHTRSGRRHISPRRKANARKEEDEMSEAESCCSSASATRRTSVQRNTRSQRKRLPADDQPEQQGDGSERSEAELGSSVILRASRTRTGAALKSLEEDTEPSEPDSCSSSISSLRNTAVRRVTRARSARAISPIPMELEADSHASRPLQTRAGRAKPASASKSQPYDSEGFESGPSNTPRRSARLCRSATQQTQLAVLSDSESGSTDVYSPLGSPCSLRAKSTPCSSRTGSANSSRALLLPQATTKAQVPMDTLSQSAQLTISNAVDVLGQEGVLGADSPLDSECKLTEELEPDNTLTAECEEMVEVQEASPNQTAIVTIFESASTNKHDGDEEQGDTMDTSVVPESPQIEVSQKSEGNTSVNEETDLAEEVSAGEMVSNCSVRVSFSNCAPVEDDNVEGKDLTGQETQEDDVDKTVIEESVEDGVGMAVRDEAEEPEKLGQKPGLFFLLESSEEEGESDDGGQSAEEQESEGSDREDNTQLDGTEAGPSHPRPEEPVPIDELFVVDTQPGLRPNEKYYLDEEQKRVESSDAEDKSEEEFIDQEVDDDEEDDDDDDDDEDAKLLFKSKKPVMELSSSIDPGLKVKEMGGLYITFDGTRSKAASDTLKKLKEQKNIDELLKKSIIGPDFERKDSVPPYKESKKALKLKRREEREKTTGDGWFNMKAPEMTQELKNDLQALKMRSAVDPKRFYKKNDREGFPKYLQVGTVVECPLDFYHSRIPKKQRKRTIVEELLADAEFRNYNKKKYKEIIAEKAALAAGRKNRKKQKFSKKEK
ncbi:deoxynucleotidyltransferase terminal-interacting protein 2 isoform X1 [Scleropages formosus]|nr:deoxynucleotidyltransferase terminal-interacting protein 2 isoform X1 [Scleropages formosus]